MRIVKEVCFNEKWSNRTQVKLIRTARTIADQAGEKNIANHHIHEAIDWKKASSLFQQQERIADG
ncbi:hypothetical protein [Sporosarcina oncorhynchi]|uniref:magnesium chelatase subunit ChlI family protein n=1 Tax=Sporosarcina oncorhynchi TaxID=3056444 RepID=UPI003D671239